MNLLGAAAGAVGVGVGAAAAGAVGVGVGAAAAGAVGVGVGAWYNVENQAEISLGPSGLCMKVTPCICFQITALTPTGIRTC
jgi:hypothetical protein